MVYNDAKGIAAAPRRSKEITSHLHRGGREIKRENRGLLQVMYFLQPLPLPLGSSIPSNRVMDWTPSAQTQESMGEHFYLKVPH